MEDAKFSIMIPTWNNLELLKICINSIKKNSHFTHQIILHVNQGDDGTLEWVQEKGYDYTYCPKNAGVCWALNACRSLVETNYIVYMNDDMYVLPDWDLALWNEVISLPDDYFFLSSTLIEPVDSLYPEICSPYRYGRNEDDFNESQLLADYQNMPVYDWSGATWPPNIVHKNLWDLVGGYSVEFFPGMYSDPDFSMKLLKAGVTHFKGVSQSLVYHFGSRSTIRVKKNKGSRQFLNKWGITSSLLIDHILKRGQAFSGPVETDFKGKKFRVEKLRSRMKRILSSFLGTGEVGS